MPDLTGKVAIVPGGDAGLGKETAKALLENNAKVYIAARNEAKIEAAIQDLQVSTGKTAPSLILDLEDFQSIQKATELFLQHNFWQETRLDILFNNAGIMMPPVEAATASGYDLSFGTNVLAPRLLPILMRTAEMTCEPSRVVNTSSSIHYLAMYNFNTFKDGPARRKLSRWANITFSNELARRYGGKGIVSTAAISKTWSCREMSISVLITSSWWVLVWFRLVRMPQPVTQRILQIYPSPWGALPQLFSGTSLEGVDFNGKVTGFMFHCRFCVSHSRKDTTDPQLGRELWTWLEA
ncbi:NAD(P)-binding protein [Mycena vitilis]|nr:NAD(P)-binding protein [Mycena vitilis]